MLFATAMIAAALNYGTGTFHGTMTSGVGAPRPHTGVTVVVKPGRAHFTHLGIAFHCSGQGDLPERFTAKVSVPWAKVSTGAAGGGLYAAASPKIRVAGHTLKADVEVNAGLRATTVMGQVDSFVEDPGGGTCDDYAKFTARR